MPACLEPDQKFPVCLDIDKDKPAESRPTFFVRALSGRGQRQLAEEFDALYGLPTPEQIYDDTFTTVAKYVTGWKNMGEHTYPCEMEAFLSLQEARELMRKILNCSYVQPDEKKS